jgi:rRNA maturation endonuclease Nob1
MRKLASWRFRRKEAWERRAMEKSFCFICGNMVMRKIEEEGGLRQVGRS